MTSELPYIVMIRCPEADKSVSTGLRCDLRTFIQLVHQELRCPECGQLHAWSQNDAWLRDAVYATGELSVSTMPRL